MATHSVEPAAEGGCDVDTDARAQSDVNKLASFLQKGEAILNTFKSSIRAFEGHNKQMKSLASTVQQIQNDLKRPRDDTGPGSSGIPTKVTRIETESESDSGDNSGFDDDDDVDCLLRKSSNTEQQNDGNNLLQDLDEFFVEQVICGPPVSENVAKVVNKALRPARLCTEKTKSLCEKYKRPSNVDSLQVPRIDGFLWNQLRNPTKSADIQRQKMINHLNAIATPLVAAMDHISTSEKPDCNILKELIGDTFKLVCTSIVTVNQQRRESIKKELDPKFKAICADENPVSATGLFGDQLSEQTKQLDSSKNIKMTAQTTQKKDFLEKRKWGGNNTPTHHQQYRQGQQHNSNQKRDSNQTYKSANNKKSHHQQKPKNRSFQSGARN